MAPIFLRSIGHDNIDEVITDIGIARSNRNLTNYLCL